MRLWKRASDALKDQSSLWQASLRRRTALGNPDIDKAVIRATSHHDYSSPSDRRNGVRVQEWLHLSPSNLEPILRSLSACIEKTRSWPVALKALLLTHALLNSPTPDVRTIGRLPFDLSAFPCPRAPPFDAFVRAYYAFLDQKSAIMFQLSPEEKQRDCEGFVMRQELLRLQKLQGLVDLLVQIRPAPTAAFAPLVLDVMDGVFVEIYDVYGRICRGIAIVLLNIYSAGKAEAAAALCIVQKATRQGDDLAYFFQFCQEIRVANAAEFLVIDRIPEEGIKELEQIIEGLTTKNSSFNRFDENAVVVREADEDSEFKTVITEEWERFNEDSVTVVGPFPATCAQQQGSRNQDPLDLINFF